MHRVRNIYVHYFSGWTIYMYTPYIRALDGVHHLGTIDTEGAIIVDLLRRQVPFNAPCGYRTFDDGVFTALSMPRRGCLTPKAFQDVMSLHRQKTNLNVPATVLFTVHYRRGRLLTIVKQTTV